MSGTHEKPSYEDVQIGPLILIGVLTIIVVFATVVAAQTVYLRYQNAEYQQKVVESSFDEVDATIAAQKARLNRVGGGANSETDQKVIPIAEAMDQVLAEYQARQGGQPGADVAAGEHITAGKP